MSPVDTTAGLAPDDEGLAETLARQLASLRPGAHLCPLYDTVAEHIRALVPFLRGGVERGEQCIYIGDALTIDDLLAHGAATDEDRDRGALVALPGRETYLRDGRFEPDAMLEQWGTWHAASQQQGFAGLRVSGSASWALDTDMDFSGFIEYEARLNDFLAATGARVMCHYEFGAFQPGIIRDVLRTHPLAIVGDHLYENVYYEPLALCMGGSDVDRQRVEWMRSQLQTRARREAAQVDLGQLALADASPTDLMNAVAQLIAAELQADLVEMFEVLPSADAYRPVAAAGSRPVSVDRIEPINPSALASGTLRAGQPLIIGDWTHETQFRRSTAARAAGVTTSAIVAISAGQGERMYGFLSVHSREPRIFSEDEIVFVKVAAVSLAHAIERRQSQEQFRALVEHAPDAIVRYDRDLRIIYVNPAVERVTGRPAVSLLGKTSRETGVLDAFLPTWELILRDVVRSGREQVTEYSLSTPQGERFFQSRIVPEFSLGHGNLVESLLVVSRDITEFRRALEEQRQLSQDLLESERGKEELLERQITAQQEELERLRRAAVLPQLSPREGQILRLLARGMTNREIGRELQLSPGTVKNHVSHLLDKLNAVDRTAAAVLASEMGWTEVAEKI